jgi:hypothetical protein
MEAKGSRGRAKDEDVRPLRRSDIPSIREVMLTGRILRKPKEERTTEERLYLIIKYANNG